MMQGILGTKHHRLALDMVENFAFLFNKFKIIPNVSSYDFLDRSQPPLLSSMILDIFNFTKDKKWLRTYIQVAKNEYKTVWVNETDLLGNIGSYHHRAPGHFLSRYGDRDAGYALNSELESGWDCTNRFYNRCNDFLPIDLNSFLYKYETDFVEVNKTIFIDEPYWQKIRTKRKNEINRFCWNEKKGFFFDYDYIHEIQSPFYSLAGFLPLWCGLASKYQASRLIKHLVRFQTNYGLTVTDKSSLPKNTPPLHISRPYKLSIKQLLRPKQWDYPFIWRPVEYLVVLGLIRYGYKKEAKKIIERALEAEARVFRKYGMFFEKINGITGDAAEDFHYPNQGGFGWTNGVFVKYVSLLKELTG